MELSRQEQKQVNKVTKRIRAYDQSLAVCWYGTSLIVTQEETDILLYAGTVNLSLNVNQILNEFEAQWKDRHPLHYATNPLVAQRIAGSSHHKTYVATTLEPDHEANGVTISRTIVLRCKEQDLERLVSEVLDCQVMISTDRENRLFHAKKTDDDPVTYCCSVKEVTGSSFLVSTRPIY